ncbi:MAG: NUDIX domain-containing protein [Candidatus Cloacimonetes bacterium]|nr:NUDIX domain-containing protein [Candidatus Cloacimonadota bacterium]
MKVEIIDKKTILDDFFKVEKVKVRHEKFDGEMSPILTRLNLKRGDAVTAIIYHKEKNALLLARQFRYSTYEKGPGWITELAAGIKEEGESEEYCIEREIEEELGYKVKDFEELFNLYMSPGGSDQIVYFFYGEVTEADRINSGGGLDTEHEDIKTIIIPVAEIEEYMSSNKIQDAKTYTGLLWFLQNKIDKIK